jgi:hypothetical protein
MRSNKEILQIMLDNVQLIRDRKGLCSLASSLYRSSIITFVEAASIQKYIMENRPFALSSIDTLRSVNSLYYWPKYKVKPRAKWLKKHIRKLS